MEIGKGLLPSCWGPMLWGGLHSIAYAYNPQIDKDNYYNFFSNLGSVLPCEECRVHYSQNVNKQELAIALESNENLFRWVYDLHNKVNLQTGVPESKWPSYESIKKLYGSFKASCSDIPGVCGAAPGKIQKKIKMVEQFGDINSDQVPFIISTCVLAFLLFVTLVYIIFKKCKNTNK
jgi:hypothetical protein